MTPYKPPQNPYTNLMYWWGQNNLAGKVLTDKAREEAERLRKQERSGGQAKPRKKGIFAEAVEKFAPKKIILRGSQHGVLLSGWATAGMNGCT
jgi:hypothetical protein